MILVKEKGSRFCSGFARYGALPWRREIRLSPKHNIVHWELIANQNTHTKNPENSVMANELENIRDSKHSK